MSRSCEVAVVGAGPAGCSTAILLALQGVDTVLVDRARFPRPKACGEGILPAGIPMLKELGVLSQVEAAGRRFTGLRFTGPGGATAEAAFPDGRYGIALEREILDALLLERARAVGLEVLEAHEAVGLLRAGPAVAGVRLRKPSGDFLELAASTTVLADGGGSRASKALGLPRRLPRRKRYGVRARFSGVRGLGRVVEVFFLRRGELYLAPQAAGTALVAALLEEDAWAAFAGRSQQAFLELVSSSLLAPRMREARAISPVAGRGPLGGGLSVWEGPGWLAAGDAASSVDPITGEGIALALWNGKLAARAVRHRVSYTSARRRLMRRPSRLSAALLCLCARPLLAEAVIAFLGRFPFLLVRALAWAHRQPQ